MSDGIEDVILVGLGPVGLTMAAVLGQRGHRVTAIERHPQFYGLPRAGHVDHEIVRILQSLDAEGPLLADSYPTVEYRWVNATGETLLEFDWGSAGLSGYHSHYMQYQPVLEAALADRVRADPALALLQGWEAVGLVEHEDHVAVTARRDGDDEVRVLRGRYLVGADGAGSFVRKALGIEREDLGFNERWLDVDARKKRELRFDFDCGQICDPRRPVTILPLGKRHRRWEWALLPGEVTGEFEKPDMAWRLLGELGVGPDDIEIVRQIVYTFEARTARAFRRGRAFLIGDAAHTMPPFMGQGMCSGMRDAKNLGWKLDLVLRGLAPDGLLDTFETELRPYVRDWTTISLESGKVPCTTDPDEARERDARFRAGWLPPMPDFPQIRHGLIHRDPGGAPIAPAGELSLQARVERDGRTELFDRAFDAAGRWQVVSTAGDPRAELDAAQLALLERLGTVFAHIGSDVGADARDVDGTYRTYAKERAVEVTIARPDFYIFGAATTQAGLPRLVDDLAAQLRMTTVTGGLG
ncbi:bifunctional 3-(3-hydroxy-phenyl)propionate/3-hydroxycinnamic acid hydroxylase MhpA [Amycolatopsis pithecellobii]|uniref:Bifunctional 3-(3-hydroxy-phenyl)propionate/3-hydroxycinnamic acid hydroxylase n=1 Tax=Amycolatopsis pithecellobii TaxID=664692 RepID=A0A6N7Z6P1_9PSEU|nr:bifunctional 3-(3-hydroxy-phenyl)propionate/3-hydroxycinnamic acid hydroxylase [Amycolatopsis pithecellobii]MTD56490.1 bifunctional 3-(3-hydroxy-phenyl)propionate/3-hydroxycinnamic acid hydroxylase [Amycolatopsis pithecellobii]